MSEIGKKYNERTLRKIRQYYMKFSDEKWSPLATILSWSHYSEILSLKNDNAIIYYINISINHHLTKRELREKIKSKEYERLDEDTKNKLINNTQTKVSDFIKNPILIKNSYNYNNISEKILKQLILEDMDNFLSELGNGFTYVGNEYKIKLGDRYNYIDLLLFNYIYNCFIVVELKITELKAEHIGQIQKYMNYIDRNIKTISQDRTIGIIIVKKDNHFVMDYCSDDRIFRSTYTLV